MSAVGCRSPDLCRETRRSTAINMWTQIVRGITRCVLSQRSVKDINMNEHLRTGNLPRFIPCWKICAAFGEFTEKAHKREREFELNIIVLQDGLKQSVSE